MSGERRGEMSTTFATQTRIYRRLLMLAITALFFAGRAAPNDPSGDRIGFGICCHLYQFLMGLGGNSHTFFIPPGVRFRPGRSL